MKLILEMKYRIRPTHWPWGLYHIPLSPST